MPQSRTRPFADPTSANLRILRAPQAQRMSHPSPILSLQGGADTLSSVGRIRALPFATSLSTLGLRLSTISFELPTTDFPSPKPLRATIYTIPPTIALPKSFSAITYRHTRNNLIPRHFKPCRPITYANVACNSLGAITYKNRGEGGESSLDATKKNGFTLSEGSEARVLGFFQLSTPNSILLCVLCALPPWRESLFRRSSSNFQPSTFDFCLVV